jgi:hypothetical protein
MSKNLSQVYTANPVTTIGLTDLLYTASSGTTDAAFSGATLYSLIPGGITTNVTVATQGLMQNQNFIANRGTLITFTLPATATIGSIIEISGLGAGGWTITQAAGQQIHVGNLASTLGTGGSVASTNQYDTIRLMCVTANTIFTVLSGVSVGYTIV